MPAGARSPREGAQVGRVSRREKGMGGRRARARADSGRKRASSRAGPKRGRWVASLALVLAVGGVAIAMLFPRGSTPRQTAASGSAASSEPAAIVPVGTQPRQRAPDFTIETSTGDPFRLSSYHGQEVVLDFLAPG